MKIIRVDISNIFSFRYDRKSSEHDVRKWINFNSDVNILIGPNGSGKSNFLQIINEIFTRYFFRNFKPQLSQSDEDNKNKNRNIEYPKINLPENRLNKEHTKRFSIELELSKSDLDNIEFIKSHIRDIIQLSEKYANAPNLFEEIEIPIQDIHVKSRITFEFRNAGPKYSMDCNFSGQESRLIHSYLCHYHFIQEIIDQHNRENDEQWPPLKNVLAVLTSNRYFDDINLKSPMNMPAKSDLYEANEEKSNQSFKESGIRTPIIFNYLNKYLRYQVRVNYDKSGNKDIEEKINDLPIVKKINSVLKDILKISFKFNYNNDTYESSIQFFDSSDNEIQITDLTPGEKEMLHFIFVLYGYDVENGLIIIDEPELHLHPQRQEQLLDLIMNSVKNSNEGGLKSQVIFATHSPIFINHKTIEDVHRFRKIDDHTDIVSYKEDSNKELDKELIQILTLTNSAKIFFVDNIILVEGPSDEYFFKSYFQNFLIDKELSHKNYEVLNIIGKNNFSLWKRFLSKFGLNVFFICDLDNIFDNEIDLIPQDRIKKLKEGFNNDYQNSTELENNDKRRYYQKLITYVKGKYPEEWKNIQENICTKYNDGVFVLKEGDLEYYLDIGKDNHIEKIIKICQKPFSDWICNTNHKKELDNIVTSIMTRINSCNQM